MTNPAASWTTDTYIEHLESQGQDMPAAIIRQLLRERKVYEDEAARIRRELHACHNMIAQISRADNGPKFASAIQLYDALKGVTASLVAARSLLASGGKKAAPSDTMFSQMLDDYQASIDRARLALFFAKEGGDNE